jgi:hypothetical protein
MMGLLKSSSGKNAAAQKGKNWGCSGGIFPLS